MAQTTARVPKYLHISEYVREGLESGRWKPGAKLPPCRVFTELFGVTPVTVWKALDELTNEGLIHRIQGKGTFVAERVAERTRLVAVATRTVGDCYGVTFDVLAQRLKASHVNAVLLDMEGEPNRLHSEWEDHFDALLQNRLDALVMDGTSYQPWAYLQANEAALPPLTFIRVFETALEFATANRIVSNWEAGGYLAASHLLAEGFGELALVSFPTVDDEPEHYCFLVAAGMNRALCEATGKADAEVLLINDDMGDAEAVGIAAGLAKGANGLLCLGDARVPRVYRAASQLGLEVGKDLGVCGYFNTSWAELIDPMITSVCIHEERIGELAAEAVTEGWQGQDVLVEPELIVRESSRRRG